MTGNISHDAAIMRRDRTSDRGYDGETIGVLYDGEPHGIGSDEWDAQQV